MASKWPKLSKTRLNNAIMHANTLKNSLKTVLLHSKLCNNKAIPMSIFADLINFYLKLHMKIMTQSAMNDLQICLLCVLKDTQKIKTTTNTINIINNNIEELMMRTLTTMKTVRLKLLILNVSECFTIMHKLTVKITDHEIIKHLWDIQSLLTLK